MKTSYFFKTCTIHSVNTRPEISWALNAIQKTLALRSTYALF